MSPANSGGDFQPVSSPFTIAFLENEPVACGYIDIVDNNNPEEPETFNVTIQTGQNVQIGPTGWRSAEVVINDDDGKHSIHRLIN